MFWHSRPLFPFWSPLLTGLLEHHVLMIFFLLASLILLFWLLILLGLLLFALLIVYLLFCSDLIYIALNVICILVTSKFIFSNHTSTLGSKLIANSCVVSGVISDLTSLNSPFPPCPESFAYKMQFVSVHSPFLLPPSAVVSPYLHFAYSSFIMMLDFFICLIGMVLFGMASTIKGVM